MIKKWLRGYLELDELATKHEAGSRNRDLEVFIIDKIREGIECSFKEPYCSDNVWGYSNNLKGSIKRYVIDEVALHESSILAGRVSEIMKDINSEETLDKIINRIKTKQLN